jgi:hypothetical protein
MRSRLKRAYILFLAVVVLAVMAIKSFLLFELKKGGGTEYTIVKEFTFSSKDSISGWEEKELSPKRTDYAIVELDGKKVLKATAGDSASTFFCKERLDCRTRPFVSWDWKVELFPERKNKETLEKKAEFDFAAQFYVVFYDRFFLKSKAIQYVWTENVPSGTSSDSPYTKNVKLLVLEKGPSAGWKHEERDIAADYSTLFGGTLERDVVAVAFMTDADSTGSSAVAYYRDVKLGYLGSAGSGTVPAVPNATELLKGPGRSPESQAPASGGPHPEAAGAGEAPKGKEQPSDI